MSSYNDHFKVWHNNHYVKYEHGGIFRKNEIIKNLYINKNWRFKVWSRPICEPYIYSPDASNLDDHIYDSSECFTVSCNENRDFVISTKNILTIDFLETASDVIFDDFSEILEEKKFNFVDKLNSYHRTHGDYKSKERMCIRRYFVEEYKASELSKKHIIRRYNTYTPPTVSIYVYKTEVQKNALCNWINNIDNKCTKFFLVADSVEYFEIQDICHKLIKYMF